MNTSAIERAIIGAIIFTLLFLAASNIPAIAAQVQAFMLKGLQ
jgi:uncharacterized membrane protein